MTDSANNLDGMSARALLLLLPFLIPALQGAAAQNAETNGAAHKLKPVLTGRSWRICQMPDLGKLAGPDTRRQNIVDHSFIQGKDGRWTLWACLRGTAVGRLFYGWQGESLLDGPLKETGVVARADEKSGETTKPAEAIQAPYFARDGDRFLCFYNSNGTRLMISTDGHTYQRGHPAGGSNHLYANGGRDVMLMRHDGLWWAYSTISTVEGRGYIILRTSKDLREWTAAKIVCEGGRGGTGRVSAESPFVLKHGGAFYLFRASSNDGMTYVYRSEVPDYFGVNDDSGLVAVLPLKAPEILHQDGKWLISDLADFQGIKLHEFEWKPTVE